MRPKIETSARFYSPVEKCNGATIACGATLSIEKTVERRKSVERPARGAPMVNRRIRIDVAEGQTAEQDVIGGKVEEGIDGLVPVGPGFHAAAVQAVLARQQHD